ncbi:MAG TPA: response regulator [Moraxellaceae bacterium]|jgi:two-component system sensor histidine kinase BarA|nr:response regulator [Moraxellaceae bacterium]HQV41271.1 response regulator [Moraxellaceae bacterium]HQX89445.1 response regulator [Moraxellaceae bacterium]
MKPWSLQSRLIVLLLVPTALLLLGLGTGMVLSRFNDLESVEQERGRLLLDRYSQAFEHLQEATPITSQTLTAEALEEPNLRSLTLVDADGNVIVHSGPTRRALTGSQHLRLDTETHRYVTADSWQYVKPLPVQFKLSSGQKTNVWILLEMGTQELTIRKYEALMIILVVSLIALILLALLLTRAIHRWLSPVSEMTNTLSNIDSMHLDYRLGTDATGDLASLQTAINALLERINTDTDELRSSMVQTNEDLRETMETMEVQNIELTLARKEAVEGNRIKSEFLANISHEIRTPLNGIMGFTKLLLKNPLTPRQLDYVRTIQKSSDSLLAIINDVLDLSKIEAGKLVLDYTPLDIEDVIFDVLNMLAPMAEEKNIEQVAFIYDDVPRHLMGDPLRLKQILINLVNNAIKFTPKGEIIVRCMLENQTERHALVRISVTDTGIGLSESARADLFRAFSQGDPSTTRKFGGTGLGLVISRHLIEQMHGEISVESTPGEGSTFWFTIRADLDRFTQPPIAGDQLKGRTIMVAEPQDVSRQFLINTLEHWGANCTSITSLSELRESLKQATPDALILSLGLSGNDAISVNSILKELRELMQGPIILLARNTDPSLEQAAYPTSHVTALCKPVPPRDLYAQLSGMLSAMSAQMALLPSGNEPKPLRVLAVDDNPANLKLVCALLDELNVKTFSASNGHEAIRLCKESDIDLVFMDIQMPGMNGLEATQAIRQHEKDSGGTRHVPIVALTAHAMANEREALLKSGMDDYLTKPVQEIQLAHMMTKWAGRPSEHGGALPVINTPLRSSDPNTIIDWEESVRLAAGKQDLARDMMLMLLTSLGHEKTKILNACESNRIDMLLEHVHYLHGATRYCGVPALREAAHDLETHIKIHLQKEQESRTAKVVDTVDCRAVLERLIHCMDELILWHEQNELPA